ncbi:uncharacterized protein [Melanerpes formicivorus]|uniref:uncharacterized protein n=1 Tax=Melanerpes formicivorus TaxID=211600 RepID=UPI003590046A
MDSLKLMLSCFLLLTAGPHSNIAMPGASGAARTQDSSTGETNVTVYLCRDPESSVCDKGAYEGCEKIDTQSNTFRLEPGERSISLCYQYPEYIPEGIIGIIWQNAKGIGKSCGTVNSEASSQNVMDDITETCCEAEINPREANSHLKCYFKTAGGKDRRSSAGITDEGNPEIPQPVIDEQSSSSSVIIPPVLIVIVCGAALGLYCVQRRRNGRGQDVIQKWLPQELHTPHFQA